MREARLWDVHEISLEAEMGYADPFATQPLATFTGPEGVSLQLPGFWDGGNVWRIRFAPPALGHWHWRTENPANPRDGGLHGRCGELLCLSTGADNPLYLHGFVRVAPSGRTLVHADGSPFFWLGDTLWRLNFAGPAEVAAYASRRQSQGFSVGCYYAAEPIPNSDMLKAAGIRPTTPLPGADYLAPRVYQTRIDPIVRILNQHGMVVFLQGLWRTELGEWGPAGCEAYWRYLVARYAAYHVVWSLWGEWDDYPPDTIARRAEVARTLGRIVRDADPYHHLITVHPREGTSSARIFHGDDWLTLNVQQTRARGDLTVVQLPWQDYQRWPAKPNLDVEHIYEGEERGSPERVRWAAYASVLQGGLVGHTYGACGVWDWNTHAHLPHSPLDLLDLPGAQQMQHLAALFRSLSAWPLLEPHRDWVTGSFAFDPDSELNPFCAVRAESLYVIYLPQSTRDITVTHLGQRSYRARWFNPSSGAWSAIAAGLPPVESWTAPEPPDHGDWVLVLDCA